MTNNTLEKMDEKKLISRLRDLLWEKKTSSLKKIYARVNLATKQFKEIWSDWWEEEIPPRMEVDLIPVFSDSYDVILVGVEVEFFREKRRSPYKGLEQALSFGLFGFDSLVLWHIFSSTLENKIIDSYVRPVKEIVEGLNLPIVYFATKIENRDKFEFFTPWYSSIQYEADYIIRTLEKSCKEKKNPLLYKSEIKNRRKVLKTILKIPV